MSRIEKAIEKAVTMRKSTKEPACGVTLHSSDGKPAVPFFEIGESILDESAIDRHIICIANPESLPAEQYRKLRERIFKLTEKDHLNTLMIASSESGEGKTLTTINLAVAIAHKIDHTVLLVDADLRNPSVHKYLGIRPQYGLSDYLMGKAMLSDVLIKTGIGKLVLLPAGNVPTNPSELIASEKMKGLVLEMKHRYHDRYIIFDSPPVLVTSDAVSLGDYVDGIIFVVQAAHTSPQSVTKALSILKGCNVLGSVFNNVPAYLGYNLYPYYYRDRGKDYINNFQKLDSGNNGSSSLEA